MSVLIKSIFLICGINLRYLQESRTIADNSFGTKLMQYFEMSNLTAGGLSSETCYSIKSVSFFFFLLIAAVKKYSFFKSTSWKHKTLFPCCTGVSVKAKRFHWGYTLVAISPLVNLCGLAVFLEILHIACIDHAHKVNPFKNKVLLLLECNILMH